MAIAGEPNIRKSKTGRMSSRFRSLPAFEQANRQNAYGTYLLMEQEIFKAPKS